MPPLSQVVQVRSTLEYGGYGTSRSVALIIDAEPKRRDIAGTGVVRISNDIGMGTFILSPVEARHLAAQLLAHAELAAS